MLDKLIVGERKGGEEKLVKEFDAVDQSFGRTMKEEE
jgi:hypothetical protein